MVATAAAGRNALDEPVFVELGDDSTVAVVVLILRTTGRPVASGDAGDTSSDAEAGGAVMEPDVDGGNEPVGGDIGTEAGEPGETTKGCGTAGTTRDRTTGGLAAGWIVDASLGTWSPGTAAMLRNGLMVDTALTVPAVAAANVAGDAVVVVGAVWPPPATLAAAAAAAAAAALAALADLGTACTAVGLFTTLQRCVRTTRGE